MALGDIWTDITSGEKLETLTLVTRSVFNVLQHLQKIHFFRHWIPLDQESKSRASGMQQP